MVRVDWVQMTRSRVTVKVVNIHSWVGSYFSHITAYTHDPSQKVYYPIENSDFDIDVAGVSGAGTGAVLSGISPRSSLHALWKGLIEYGHDV